MSMTRLTCLPVRVVCFGISGTIAFTGGTGCWAVADITVSMAAAMPAAKADFVCIGLSRGHISAVSIDCGVRNMGPSPTHRRSAQHRLLCLPHVLDHLLLPWLDLAADAP